MASLVLALYALHQGVLLLLFLCTAMRRKSAHPVAQTTPNPARALPSVMVQLPLYNERFVAERIIRACAALDYPTEKLHIQVLDDSSADDDTTRIAQLAVDEARARHINIDLVHRDHRHGYKAGALAHGLHQTTAEFIAVFDADFVPPNHFLRSVLQQCRAFDDPTVGFVQTRWGHLNRTASLTTRAQAMMLDLHFLIEQSARSYTGMPLAFNGSGGIWRRACIEDAGGWQADTLTEDLDLSYRARLRGWRGVFLSDVVSPGELPCDVLAYKQQQARWARGTVQCMHKLLAHVFRSTRLSLRQKCFAFMHISGYLIHPLLLVMMLTPPLLLMWSVPLPQWLGWVSVLSLSPLVSMAMAQALQRRPWLQVVADLPFALMLGIGVAFSNSASMVLGLQRQHSGEFVRTPKVSVAPSSAPKTYGLGANWTMWVELALVLYGLTALAAMFLHGYWFATLPTLLYVLGFASVGLSQLLRWLSAKSAQWRKQDVTDSPISTPTA
jgi:cellulose synthase/poly-beta-1,6-N-acetylglucosamine synthase-like glycosyltransferase